MRKDAARLLIAGTGSGCGKTTLVCAILQALVNRKLDTAAFKCGPDYIDPMFHAEILGIRGSNLDLFFTDGDRTRSLFLKHAGDINVIEGVMGYYDGLSAASAEASAWHMAQVLDAPAVLAVDARGMALSAAAAVKGFLTLRSPSRIAGILLNRVSASRYPQIKSAIESECGVPVYGFLPDMPGAVLESRHLGLVTAQEVEGLRSKMQLLAKTAEECVDIAGLLDLMRNAPALEADPIGETKIGDVRVAVARDRAFCFYYRENLELLEELGASLVPFSPLEDDALPECDGLYIGGGYPELYPEQLSRNARMRASVREAVLGGLPTIAECGGFMYLTGQIAGHPMAGVLPGGCVNRGRLVRFGYQQLIADRDSLLFGAGDAVRGHEFHYWDAEQTGNALRAVKPSGRSWRCGYAWDTLYAGFPHLYFPGCPNAARRFVRRCVERKMRNAPDGDREEKL
ncbi:MAG: cobyrinate a,c-diamide synthase [Clostridia bacterium]|nr:cobyrinate a,c-diamide synthase [Clostridia bacterium]